MGPFFYAASAICIAPSPPQTLASWAHSGAAARAMDLATSGSVKLIGAPSSVSHSGLCFFGSPYDCLNAAHTFFSCRFFLETACTVREK